MVRRVAKAAYANQVIVTMGAKPLMDSSHPYTKTNIDAMQQAMCNLKEAGLKMWLYLSKNEPGFQLGLSRKACEEWGIKKGSYYNGIEDLKNNGYLVEVGSNEYQFNEIPIIITNEEPIGFEDSADEEEDTRENAWGF